MFLDIADLIIPGYKSLSPTKRASFEQSMVGHDFSNFVRQVLKSTDEVKAKYSLWRWAMGTHQAEKQKCHDNLEQQKRALVRSLDESAEFSQMRWQITFKLLKKSMPDLKFLTKTQKRLLSQYPRSLQLQNSLIPLEHSILKRTQELLKLEPWDIAINPAGHLETLNTQKAELIKTWTDSFLNLPEMQPLRQTIGENKEEYRKKELARQRAELIANAHALAEFFPVLYYRKSINDNSWLSQLLSNYLTQSLEVNFQADVLEKQQLSDLFFHFMHEANQVEISFVNLEEINKKYAEKMAEKALLAFKNKSALDFDTWFAEYEQELQEAIINKLYFINAKITNKKPITLLKETLVNSLSGLWGSKPIDKLNQFIGKMADAHGFIQATGFSNQNESSFLAILDLYNYGRYHEQISEGKSVIIGLLSPLRTIYNEYKDIGLYEKNSYWKFFRTIMPLAIVVGIILLTALSLVPFALPELAVALAFIPALLIGLAVVTKYIEVKNGIYYTLRELYYGGRFEIPEFQVNTRLIAAFGSQAQASKVRSFYITELQNCDRIEKEYNFKHQQGILSEEDIEGRKQNINKRHHLCLEWYDIHSNTNISYKEARVIFIARTQQDLETAGQKLKGLLQEDLQSITHSVAQVVKDLKTSLKQHTSSPEYNEENEKETTVIHHNYRYGLFTPPRCLPLKLQSDELLQLHDEVSELTC